MPNTSGADRRTLLGMQRLGTVTAKIVAKLKKIGPDGVELAGASCRKRTEGNDAAGGKGGRRPAVGTVGSPPVAQGQGGESLRDIRLDVVPAARLAAPHATGTSPRSRPTTDVQQRDEG